MSLFPVLFALATHTFQRKQCAESQQEQSSEQQQCTPALRFWELQETLCRMPPHSLHQPGTGLVSWDNCSMMRSCKYLNGAQTLIRLKMGENKENQAEIVLIRHALGPKSFSPRTVLKPSLMTAAPGDCSWVDAAEMDSY